MFSIFCNHSRFSLSTPILFMVLVTKTRFSLEQQINLIMKHVVEQKRRFDIPVPVFRKAGIREGTFQPVLFEFICFL